MRLNKMKWDEIRWNYNNKKNLIKYWWTDWLYNNIRLL